MIEQLQGLLEQEPFNKIKHTAFLRGWALKNVSLLYWVKPTVTEISETTVAVKIPLNRRTRNHLKSMYFGALATGADCAAGYVAFKLAADMRPLKFSTVFKDFKAEFLKRPEGDVVFTCDQAAEVRELMQRAAETPGERLEYTCQIRATVPSLDPEIIVAKFELTLSVKCKS